MRQTWIFPITAFLMLLIPTEVVIAVLARSHRPREIPVVRGTFSTATSPGEIDSDAIDHFMSETLRRSGIPGVALAIVRGERILHTAGYGRNADGSPVTPDTPMALASVSKSFTALAVMRLVEDGRVALDAPFRQYVPEFEPVDPRAARITVR